MLDVIGKDKAPFTPADGPQIDTLFLIDRGGSNDFLKMAISQW